MSYEVLLSDRLFRALDGPIRAQRSFGLDAGTLGRIWESRASIFEAGVDRSRFCICTRNDVFCLIVD